MTTLAQLAPARPTKAPDPPHRPTDRRPEPTVPPPTREPANTEPASAAPAHAALTAPPAGSAQRTAEPATARRASPQPVSTPDWGRNTELSALETVMWRADTNRSLRSPLLALEQLQTVPDRERFITAHEWLVRMVPRLRQRVVEAPLDLGTPRWSTDPHFDLRFHVWRTRLAAGGGWPELLERAARFAMAPLDRARPPWEAVLVEGLPDGRAAYLLKLHHSLTDGLGAAQLLELLHSRHPQPDPRGPATASATSAGASVVEPAGPLDVLAHQLRSDVSAVPGLLRAAGSGALGALSNPPRALRSASRYASSLRRVMSTLSAEPSPLLAERGVVWRFSALDIPLRDLRAAARAAGGTLHDAYLAALLGAYRGYHAALGQPVDTLPMAIPISVRRPGDPAGGNRITASRFCAPVGVVDPVRRIQLVRELIRGLRTEPALDAVGAMVPTLAARLPAALSTQLVGSMTRANDLQASFVPGTRAERHLAGAYVERVYPFAPRPGCPAMIALVTHQEVGCVGVNFDPASFTRPELFIRCLVDGFTEVLALHPGAAAPLIRR